MPGPTRHAPKPDLRRVRQRKKENDIIQVDADVAAGVENMFAVRAENAAKSGRMRLA